MQQTFRLGYAAPEVAPSNRRPLETVLIDDRIKKDLEAPMENALNGLEEAIYSCTESDPYAKGLSVVRQLLEEIALLKSKLQKEPGLLRLYEAK